MTYTQEDERDAHVENMRADTEFKRQQTQLEPWKMWIAGLGAGAAIFGAGAAFTLAVIALLTYLRH